MDTNRFRTRDRTDRKFTFPSRSATVRVSRRLLLLLRSRCPKHPSWSDCQGTAKNCYEAYATDHPVLTLYEVDSGRETILRQGPVDNPRPSQAWPRFFGRGSATTALSCCTSIPPPQVCHSSFFLMADGWLRRRLLNLLQSRRVS